MSVEVEEATPEQCVQLARAELAKALEADSLEHMRMHLESATIWLRDVDPEVVRAGFVPDCGCFSCVGDKPAYPGSWLTVGMSMMIVCPECGNKRCPHGTDHRLACTASNDAGQDGSRY